MYYHKQDFETLEDLSKDLYDALRHLYDYQNGCPLPKYKKQWDKTMKKSLKTLSRYEKLMDKWNNWKE